jgi:hypothetical protein
MSIYVWNSEPKEIYVWTTPVKEVYVWTTKVRPTYKPRTFTISRTEQQNMSSWWTYSDDAAWLTAWDTAFDEFFWYSAVLLDANWNEIEEVTQSSPWVLNMWSFNWALTGTANNVMIKFPRRWIKMSKNWSIVTLSITEEPNKDGYQYYAHTKGTAAKNNLYLWAYEWTFTQNNSTVSAYSAWKTYLKSWATKSYLQNRSPAGYRTIAEFRATAAKNWNWYSLMTWYPRQYINALYMMKYGNPDSTSVIWKWYSSSSSRWAAPWATNTYTSATYGNTSSNGVMKLFWLENIYGNSSEKLDWCFLNNSKQLTVDKTNNIFQSSDYNTNLWTAVWRYMWWIVGTNDGMFYNVTNAGSASYYYKSIYNLSSWYDSVIVSYTGSGWIFYTNVWDDYSNIWARLMYL